MFTTRIAAARTPITTAGKIGARVRAVTWASAWANGRLLSRAMANMSRTDPAWTARAQTNTAKITSTSRKIAELGPEHVLDEKRQAAVIRPSSGRLGSLTARMPNKMSSPPAIAGGGEGLEDRPGSAAAGLVGLLGQRAGRVEPVQDIGGHERGGQEWAQVAQRLAVAPALRSRTRPRDRGGSSPPSSTIKTRHADQARQ